MAIAGYNAGIKLAGEGGDFATREILEQILNDEDKHIDEIEFQYQISHMTLPIFLTTQVEWNWIFLIRDYVVRKFVGVARLHGEVGCKEVACLFN